MFAYCVASSFAYCVASSFAYCVASSFAYCVASSFAYNIKKQLERPKINNKKILEGYCPARKRE